MSSVLLSSDLLEALPDAIVAVDREGTIRQVNSQARELFGYDQGELIGQKVEILVPDSYRSQHHGHREKFAQTPKTRRMGADLDLYGRRRDGSVFPVEISLSPVSTEAGWHVLSAIRDISDRKRIAEELRRANEELHQKTAEQIGEYRSRLASIIDSSEDAILSKDLNGIITSWNKGAERIYGYAPQEVIGKPMTILTPSDRPNEISEILEKIARGEILEHHESVRVTKDGRHLDVSISVSPLRNAIGEVVGHRRLRAISPRRSGRKASFVKLRRWKLSDGWREEWRTTSTIFWPSSMPAPNSCETAFLLAPILPLTSRTFGRRPNAALR